MAVEQDWAAYADQAILNASDTLLARTSAGAGVEVPGSALVRYNGAGHAVVENGGWLLMAGASTGDQMIRIGAGRTGNGYSYVDLQGDATYANGLRLIRGNTGPNTFSNIEHRGTGPLQLVTQEAAPITFLTSAGERARIDSAGNLMLGTSTLSWSNINAFTFGSGQQAILHSTAAGSGTIYQAFVYNGTQIGSILQSGTTGVSFNTSSDHRLKEDYQPLTGALDRIRALPVYDFRWIASGERARGFKAHEYGEVIPGAATGEKDGMREETYEVEPARPSDVLGPDGAPVMIPAVMGTRLVPDYQGIDQSKAVPDLVGAVQELAALVEALSARVAELEAAQ